MKKVVIISVVVVLVLLIFGVVAGIFIFDKMERDEHQSYVRQNAQLEVQLNALSEERGQYVTDGNLAAMKRMNSEMVDHLLLMIEVDGELVKRGRDLGRDVTEIEGRIQLKEFMVSYFNKHTECVDLQASGSTDAQLQMCDDELTFLLEEAAGLEEFSF